jgi:hypothetical protein
MQRIQNDYTPVPAIFDRDFDGRIAAGGGRTGMGGSRRRLLTGNVRIRGIEIAELGVEFS